MTRLHEQIITPTDIDEAFAYTADFANIQDWDPGIATSARVGAGPIGTGSSFELLVAFGGRRIPMTYTITEYEPPHRLVLVGEGAALTAVDEITFATVPQGTAITYTADLMFKGALRFVVPLMGGVLEGVGRKAVEGLGRVLDDGSPLPSNP